MNYFMKPAIKLMNNLNYGKKLGLIGIVFLLAILTSVVVSPFDRYAEMQDANLNIAGLSTVKILVSLMKNVQEYRQDVNDVRNGTQNLNDELVFKKNSIQQQIGNVNSHFIVAAEKYNIPLNNKSWEDFKTNWNIISSDSSLPVDSSSYFSMMINLRDFILDTCDSHKLSYDENIESYYLSNNICRHLPNFTEEMSEIKLLTSNAIYNKTISNRDKDILWSDKFLLNDLNLTIITKNTRKVVQVNPGLQDSLLPLLEKIQNNTTDISKILDESFVNGAINIPQQNFFQKINDLSNTTFEFYNVSMSALSDIYHQQLHTAKNSLYINFLYYISTVLILLYLFIGMYISMNKEISKLVRGSECLARGDLSTKIELETKDELSKIAFSFNQMRDTLEKFIKEMQSIVSNAAKGNLSQRISLENKQGFSKELSETTNQMTETYQNIINEVLRVFNALSKGNLTVKIEQDYEGSLSELKKFVNTTISSLQKLISDIKVSTDTIEKAAKEVAIGSGDLLTRTEQQATFIEETAASIEELTTTVKKNADNAQQASQLALSASDVATTGSELIQKVIIMMDKINEGAKKVSDIIGVIDGIAFQTNILALNAAVEAARAGEQGRGFAVVAMEVRNLAQRASSAAKEIKELITNSVENVAAGTKLVDQTGQTMESIVKEVKHVTEIMGEIATASDEQSTGIEQVNTAMAQMDQVIGKNMQLVDNEAQAAESMEKQTEHMKDLVQVFKLENDQEITAEQNLAPTKIAADDPLVDENKISQDKKDIWDKF